MGLPKILSQQFRSGFVDCSQALSKDPNGSAVDVEPSADAFGRARVVQAELRRVLAALDTAKGLGTRCFLGLLETAEPERVGCGCLLTGTLGTGVNLLSAVQLGTLLGSLKLIQFKGLYSASQC